jgi:hypothetical protein
MHQAADNKVAMDAPGRLVRHWRMSPCSEPTANCGHHGARCRYTLSCPCCVCAGGSGGGGGGYDARVWQPHVLAHLPLYGVLVPLAAEAAAARVRARGPEPAATLLKVCQL